MKIRITITDDHPLFLEGLKNIILRCPEFELIGAFCTGNDLLASLQKQQPDIAIVDIHLPDTTGDDLTQLIHSKYPQVKLIALTNLDTVYYIKTMLGHGVRGYMLKTMDAEAVVAGIMSVFNGGTFVEPSLKDKLVDDLGARTRSLADIVITRREREVLQLIAANFTSQEIANKLFLSKRTIDFHRNSLLLKFGVKNSAAVIKDAMSLGLLD